LIAPDKTISPNEVPCKVCGESILKTARKCRHCGEYQAEADRKRFDKLKSQASGDEELTTGEIAFGILCSGIACILGLVWVVQGKQKGWKLVGIAFVSQVVIGFLRAMAGR
jgi:hypothetical protein